MFTFHTPLGLTEILTLPQIMNSPDLLAFLTYLSFYLEYPMWIMTLCNYVGQHESRVIASLTSDYHVPALNWASEWLPKGRAQGEG